MVSWESDNFTDIFNILRVQRETTVAGGGGGCSAARPRQYARPDTIFFRNIHARVWVTNLTLATTQKHAALCPKIMNACVN